MAAREAMSVENFQTLAAHELLDGGAGRHDEQARRFVGLAVENEAIDLGAVFAPA